MHHSVMICHSKNSEHVIVCIPTMYDDRFPNIPGKLQLLFKKFFLYFFIMCMIVIQPYLAERNDLCALRERRIND